MKKWQVALCFVVIGCCSCDHVSDKHMYLLPGRNMLNIIPDILGQAPNQSTVRPEGTSKLPISLQERTTNMAVTLSIQDSDIETEIARESGDQQISVPTTKVIQGSDTSEMKIIPQFETGREFGPTAPPFSDLTSLHPPHIPHHPVQHASLPQGMHVLPIPLKDSDHELVFNVSWNPPVGPTGRFTRDYSIVVNSITKTSDCDTPTCYECCIPGHQTWAVVPSISHPVAETCAIKPGCTYQVTLTAHPWDGHTAANMMVELDECVAGVCSCAHAARLPSPVVSAQTILVQGDLFVNVTWSLPPSSRNIRLPRDLMKKYYFISVGKQMVSNAHPSPWFTRGTSRKLDALGKVSSGDKPKWFLLPVNEKKGDKKKSITPDVRLLARVNLIDERGCVGPAGNATVYDPTTVVPTSLSAYVLWATLGGVVVLATAAVVVVSAGAVKKVLRALRPAPVSAPLEPLRLRNAWFALQLHTNNENPSRGQVEQSPLYTHKVFEPPEEAMDEWEVQRSRIHLGALIGSGAFGRVHAAQLLMPEGETITVAAKMLNENASNEEMQDFLGEINMLKHVGCHKHVIRLIGCCTIKAPLIALLEHAPRGDLLSLLRSARGRRKADVQDSNVTRRVDSDVNGRPSEVESEYTNLSDSDLALAEEKLYADDFKRNKDHYVAEPALHLGGSTMREYALQVALGMRHLEERGITHRDLAARNILVDGAGLLKVADFGLSRSGIYVHTKAKPVPLRWLAPEAILLSQYSGKSDVWAFAVLLWEIATLGGFPYAELSNHQVPAFLTTGQRLPKPVRASPRLYELMEECWAEEPQDRPTFAQIVDKLSAQKQLYVDLETMESVFQDEVSAGLSDYDFSMSSADWPSDR